MKSKLAITLDDDLIEKLKVLAKNKDRSISSQINQIVKEYFRERAEK